MRPSSLREKRRKDSQVVQERRKQKTEKKRKRPEPSPILLQSPQPVPTQRHSVPNSYNSCKFESIVNFLSSQCFLPLGFHVKILCHCMFYACDCYFQTLIHLLVVCDQLSDKKQRKISTTNWYFHWDLRPNTQVFSPKTFLKKPLPHQRWPQESAPSPSTAQHPKARLFAPLGAWSLHQSTISRIQPKIPAPRLRR